MPWVEVGGGRFKRTDGLAASRRLALAAFLVFMLLLWVPLAHTQDAAFAVGKSGNLGGADTDHGAPFSLYLTENPGAPNPDRWNFTTFAPNGDGNQRTANQKALPTFEAHWSWFLLRAPKTWSIQQGDQWELSLFIEGLDELLPLPGDPWASSSLGNHQIQVTVLEAANTLAEGTLEVGVYPILEGINAYTVPVTFQDDRSLIPGEGPSHLRIDITVTGTSLGGDSPLVLHFGSSQHPSELSAPGYPHGAYRGLEGDP